MYIYTHMIFYKYIYIMYHDIIPEGFARLPRWPPIAGCFRMDITTMTYYD
jgi:hypothetical protein